MTEDIVVFKGNKDGLHLIVDESCGLEELQNSIHKKITSARSFFQGITKIKFSGTSISKEDLYQLTEWFKDHFEIELDTKGNQEPDKKYFQSYQPLNHNAIEEGITKFVYSTIRSGRKLQYNGNLVIIGDVNPGAEVVATGNIIVMGTLRGIAHAGALGNRCATVAAFSLQPTQLRIADVISRSPDTDFRPTSPEKACINGETIVIMPYYKNI